MLGGINAYSYSMYAQLFKNPLSPSEINPISNMIYGSGITAMYADRLGSIFKNDLSVYMQSFSSNINQLKNTSSDLSGISKSVSSVNSILNIKAVKPENSNILTGYASPNAEAKEYSIKVDSLAKAQVNTSTALASNTSSSFATGINSLKINYGSKSSDISINIKSYQSNKDVLSELSNRINQSNIGLTSKLAETKDGKSYLTITAKDTGEINKFEINDVTGNLAAKSGVNSITQEAKDAVYELDGKESTSASNTIYLDSNNLGLTLIGTGETKVKVSTDSASILDSVKGYVQSYNNTLNFLNSNNGTNKNVQQLKNALNMVIDSQKIDLQSIGIRENESGTLTVDDRKLSSAINNNLNKVKNTIGGYNGIAAKTYKLMEQAADRPVSSFANVDLLGSAFNKSGLYSFNGIDNSFNNLQSIQPGIMFDLTL